MAAGHVEGGAAANTGTSDPGPGSWLQPHRGGTTPDRHAHGPGGTEDVELVGDYHNGPISVISPFGIFGVLAFGWFLVAGLRALHRNYQFGHPAYRQMNRFLLA